MLQDEGVSSIVGTIASNLAKGQFGSDSSAVASSDGGVKTPIASTLVDLTTVGTSGRSISAKHTISSVLGNGNTFAEHEIVLSDGTSITRNTFSSFNKTSSIEVIAFTIFTIAPQN